MSEANIKIMDNEYQKGAQQLVRKCACLKFNETSYIIANPETEDVAHYLHEAILQVSPHCQIDIIPPASMHGTDAPNHVAKNMLNADVIFCLTSMSMAHTEARQAATKKGGRFLSLPDYSLAQLASPALLFDFSSLKNKVETLSDILDKGNLVKIITPLGTSLKLNISGRKAN